MAAPLRADAAAQTRKYAADDQNVGINHFHGLASFVRTTVNKSEIRISKFVLSYVGGSETNSVKKFQAWKIQNTGYDLRLKLFIWLFEICCEFRISCC